MFFYKKVNAEQCLPGNTHSKPQHQFSNKNWSSLRKGFDLSVKIDTVSADSAACSVYDAPIFFDMPSLQYGLPRCFFST